MGFTKKCYINKNTPEIQNILKKMGYIEFESNANKLNNNSKNGIEVNCFHKGKFSYINEKSLSKYKDNYINCEDNESLFLAIAALNNNTDKYQFFIRNKVGGHFIGNPHFEYVTEGPLELCLIEKRDYMFNIQVSNIIPAHKASVDELIKNIKDLEVFRDSYN